MADKDGGNNEIRGYGAGNVDAVISVEEVERQAAAIAEEITVEQLDQLATMPRMFLLITCVQVTEKWKYSTTSACV